ncbi:hypothetical protein [Clostridium sp.]|uniref:hypothetical protein n=1 Tax=Clostridium sp. TaxID=1506 RepID=UPI001EBA0C6A|nr:hypothetical protein [Clostridium sp.]MBS5884323.1 hypothetical protein [Clostridium sp.]
MKESNLKIAQKDIDDALKTVEDIVSVLDNTDLTKNVLKEKFVTLTEKVQELENILKTEGIL